MDLILDACTGNESFSGSSVDYRLLREPIWILGKRYLRHEMEDMKHDIRSRLWFTYRKGFKPIGDSGLTSDKGWGCMLRCGQMILAQSLLFLHLGRNWVWSHPCTDTRYLNVLRLFVDTKSARYSVHQIALMGAIDGKQVGDWFGPNTVAQALKKLAEYDDWSNLAIHVALDNTIVIKDIKKLCLKQKDGPRGSVPEKHWKPLLLIIPLRLGINEINPVYFNSLKTCFMLPQSVGAIGGRPNHALYFIGIVGEEIIYLDPHTTQPSGDNLDEKSKKIDQTYHSPHADKLPLAAIDPSIGVGFLCKKEEDFDDLCSAIKRDIMSEKQPLFEFVAERTHNWTEAAEDALGAMANAMSSSTSKSKPCDDSEEEFEFLDANA